MVKHLLILARLLHLTQRDYNRGYRHLLRYARREQKDTYIIKRGAFER